MAERKTLIKTPESDDSIYQFYTFESESDFEFTGSAGRSCADESAFVAMFSDSPEFYDFQQMNLASAWDYFYAELDQILKTSKIKKGFMEILDGGWRKQHGFTEAFTIDAESVIQKLSINGEFCVEVWKEGHQVGFTRYSHDEPTGAEILLKSEKHLDSVRKEILR